MSEGSYERKSPIAIVPNPKMRPVGLKSAASFGVR